MRELVLVLPVLLPVVFWSVYHYRKDRDLPEPVGLLLLAFGLGMLAVGLSAALYRGLGLLGFRFDASALAESGTLGLFGYALLAIGPIEELSKLLPFALVILRLRQLDEPVDGIIYASFIGLGYAAVENWQYLDYLTRAEAYARGFASPVVHIVLASIWGLWMTQALLGKRSVWRAALRGFLVAAVLHGLYDFIVLLSPGNALPLAGLMIAAVWLWRLRVLHQLKREASQEP
jgi:RsiW-degrading membrane proteinase PrsW (M82 family)